MYIKKFTLTVLLAFSCVFYSYAQQTNDKAIEAYELGVQLYKSGDYQQAINKFNEAIAQKYPNPEDIIGMLDPHAGKL